MMVMSCDGQISVLAASYWRSLIAVGRGGGDWPAGCGLVQQPAGPAGCGVKMLGRHQAGASVYDELKDVKKFSNLTICPPIVLLFENFA